MFDPADLRAMFPALRREVGGHPAAYLDGPGGTQVPTPVIDAMRGVLEEGAANLGGSFAASESSERVTARARTAMADLLNAERPEEIVFGQNMTSLTFSMSRAIARTWTSGDNMVVTRLDHDANITPWLMAAAERGVEVRWADFDPADCTIDPAGIERLVDGRTRLVAVTHASNATGSVVDVAAVAERAHRAGALVYVDAVHYAAHGLIDVQALDCDFLVCSAYKFFGPHTGILYGRHRLLDELDAYRVRPAPAAPPGKWETGTQSFESLAGVTAAVDYLAGIGGETGSRRQRLAASWAEIGAHEADLTARFLAGAAQLPSVTVYGITEGPGRRVPTFAMAIDGVDPADAAARLGARGVFTWSGHYYAVAVMERLGVADRGGLLRIGFVHYSTRQEVDRVLAELAEFR